MLGIPVLVSFIHARNDWSMLRSASPTPGLIVLLAQWSRLARAGESVGDQPSLPVTINDEQFV